MQIFFIRHGSTAGNLERRYVGTTDEALTAEAVRELRLRRGSLPVPDVVFVSPLQRCMQTAKILFPEAQKVTLPGLRECDFGEFEYKNYEELRGCKVYQSWIDSGGTTGFPGGESREEFTKRCCAAFETGCREAMQQGAKRAAFVVHGGTIMAILDKYSIPHKDYFDWQVKNGGGFCGELCKAPAWCLKNLVPLPDKAEPTGIEDQFVMKKNKQLSCGYTTGSCAAAAAKAAAEMLLTGWICSYADLLTPKGVRLHLPVVEQRIFPEKAVCAVRKYGGDDPDATDGALIYATVQRIENEDGRQSSAVQIEIDGGLGVGRVTRPGLEQPVGAAAINRVPREMIAREVAAVCEAYEYTGGIRIVISVPAGVETAKKTFNPHLGIAGGISILGTSGIVVPMSEEALIASIRVEMKQKYENGEKYLLITPGNYGADFIRKKELTRALDAEHSMKCSNYVGETLDIAAELGVKGILFVAHIGKFIKVSGGIMNTHSACADCRAELIAAQAVRALPESASGKGLQLAKRLLETNTTEEAVGILREEGILEATMKETLARIHYHLQKRCQGAFETEVVLFSNQYGYLGETDGAERMMERLQRQIEQNA